jgi:hypothetical protein
VENKFALLKQKKRKIKITPEAVERRKRKKFMYIE